MVQWKYAAYSLAYGTLACTAYSMSGYSAYQVTGRSMQPTLNPNSYKVVNRKPALRDGDTLDWVLTSRVDGTCVSKGDVVTIHNPIVPTDRDIKRVIATENELVKTKSYKNRLVVVPKGYIWVEGDNQSCSRDSNYYGPLPASLVFGKAVAIVYPPWRWQWLKSEVPRSSFHELDVPETVGRSLEDE